MARTVVTSRLTTSKKRRENCFPLTGPSLWDWWKLAGDTIASSAVQGARIKQKICHHCMHVLYGFNVLDVQVFGGVEVNTEVAGTYKRSMGSVE